jgi:(2Fe-2S) ferredoxin
VLPNPGAVLLFLRLFFSSTIGATLSRPLRVILASAVAQPPYFPTRAHLLLCTGPRCARSGSARLFADAWSALEKRGLAYYKTGGSVRLTESGCLGACDHGPTLACYASTASCLVEGWYDHADLRLIVDVAEKAHAGEALPNERRFGPR